MVSRYATARLRAVPATWQRDFSYRSAAGPRGLRGGDARATGVPVRAVRVGPHERDHIWTTVSQPRSRPPGRLAAASLRRAMCTAGRPAPHTVQARVDRARKVRGHAVHEHDHADVLHPGPCGTAQRWSHRQYRGHASSSSPRPILRCQCDASARAVTRNRGYNIEPFSESRTTPSRDPPPPPPNRAPVADSRGRTAAASTHAA